MAFEFITGPAGSGKTFGVRKRVAESEGTMRLCATTGIAAVNLGGDVSTIHSLLGYFDTPSLADAFRSGKLKTKLSKLRHVHGVEQLVVDEVSMLGGDALSYIVRGIQTSGVQIGVTLVGDFCQLPPVNAPFAFEADEWEHFSENTTRLTKMYRQDAPLFLEALNLLRRGDDSCFDFFRDLLASSGTGAGNAAASLYGRPGIPIDDGEGRTTIFSTNAEADRYNASKLAALDTESIRYTARYWGKLRSEWLKHIDEVLHVKVGAPVMILANQRAEKLNPTDPDRFVYVNGDLGVVVGKGVTSCEVEMQRTGEIVDVTVVSRDNEIPIDSERAAYLLKYHPDKLAPGFGNRSKDESSWRYERIGGIVYMPLRLAWAATAHKTQGLSLDAIQVDVRHPFFQTPGMLYVALSRARTASRDRLKIIGTEDHFRRCCKANPKLKGWF